MNLAAHLLCSELPRTVRCLKWAKGWQPGGFTVSILFIALVSIGTKFGEVPTHGPAYARIQALRMLRWLACWLGSRTPGNACRVTVVAADSWVVVGASALVGTAESRPRLCYP